MKYFIFRNYTIEPFFKGIDAVFSGYEEISSADQEADRYIWFYLAPYKTDNEIISEEINNYGNLLEYALQGISTNKPVLVFTIQSVFSLVFQSSDTAIDIAIENYNRKIRRLADEYRNVKTVDIAQFYRNFSNEQLIDWKYYYLSQMPLNPKLAPDFNHWFTRQLELMELKRKKCLVVDLDNTLWGGILGEDGLDGIKIGESYPGNTYRFFQEYLLQLYKAGIILTVCSKNNEQDVLEVWQKHPDMLIHKEHITTYRINWNNKADNIREIAEELNIGLDSLVFIDDNPTERELIKQMLPQVIVPDFPAQPYLFPKLIKQLTDNYFSTYQLTKEDITKTQQYKENAERRQYQSQFTDFESYLKSLEIELTIETVNDLNIARLAQMTQKTNQFNLTTQRYTETDIRNFSDKGSWIYGLRVKDRFGDNGLTGLIIAVKNGEFEAEIDTFLLSCRILGKNIESVFLQYVLMKLKAAGVKWIKASYIKTAKNSQVETFYEKSGFDILFSSGEQNKYQIHTDEINFLFSNTYKILEK